MCQDHSWFQEDISISPYSDPQSLASPRQIADENYSSYKSELILPGSKLSVLNPRLLLPTINGELISKMNELWRRGQTDVRGETLKQLRRRLSVRSKDSNSVKRSTSKLTETGPTEEAKTVNYLGTFIVLSCDWCGTKDVWARTQINPEVLVPVDKNHHHHHHQVTSVGISVTTHIYETLQFLVSACFKYASLFDITLAYNYSLT